MKKNKNFYMANYKLFSRMKNQHKFSKLEVIFQKFHKFSELEVIFQKFSEFKDTYISNKTKLSNTKNEVKVNK